MSKLSNDWLVKCNNSKTELGGILLGYKKENKPVFIDFKNRDSDLGNKNFLFIIGKPGSGRRWFYEL
ncbi:hypothetical protein GFC01_15370 [Desulfofundulus thermobenzoicus]|uniref:Uncharacterized protein n=1 Tax=Desulfofundulus thermobenzoicus TaxID=29376 RepID=A0A6N7IVW8_9FIRM|nr:hypothetical protein [Desulfofundulus thermobenzoicus]MQL53617.1 hypothetical protein [Desulfofundulus thermobenzoicus]